MVTLFFAFLAKIIIGGFVMINFEEELKNFQPSLEVEEAESAIYNHDLTDVTDIIAELLRERLNC